MKYISRKFCDILQKYGNFTEMCRKIVARKIWIFLMNKFKMASSTGSDDDDSVKGKIDEWQESSQVLQFFYFDFIL